VSDAYNIVLFVALGIVLRPLGTLLHEAGHALAALRLTDGPVLMEIGQGRARAGRRVGPRFGIAICERPGKGGRVLCAPARTKRDTATIAAAGPAATLLTGLVAGLLALRAYLHHAPDLELFPLAAFTVNALSSLLLNGGRNVLQTEGGRLQATDGEQIARAAGARPTTAPHRTSPIAWVLLAIVAGLVVLVAFDDPMGGSVSLVALAVIFLVAHRAERRQRAR
jgi:hypothetical protein